jgi:hypothetical protein
MEEIKERGISRSPNPRDRRNEEDAYQSEG